MPELRKNIATNEWVVVATERAKRPDEMAEKADYSENIPDYAKNCPFCPGNESMSPDDILKVESNGKWQIRVVPNKFPALKGDRSSQKISDGIIQCIDGIGSHEVIIETPSHNQTLSFFDEPHIENLLQVYKKRYMDLEKMEHIRHIIIFKNHGPKAGTSLEHPHSQLIAMPVVPTNIWDRIEDARYYYKTFERCVFCTMISEEISRKERIILESENFVVMIPYAAYSPFHSWILPKRHIASFSDTTDKELKDLAKVFKIYFSKIYKGLKNPSFNFVIRSSPCKEEKADDIHWYIAVVLRLTNTAGFEMGSGIFINVSLPENDAAFLRGIEV